jgi:hypothetical protein
MTSITVHDIIGIVIEPHRRKRDELCPAYSVTDVKFLTTSGQELTVSAFGPVEPAEVLVKEAR